MKYFRIISFSIISLLLTFVLLIKIEVSSIFPEQIIFQLRKEKPITIFVAGDIMLDRGVKRLIDENGPDYPFRRISNIIKQSDIAIANLEGVFSDFQSVALKDHTILRFTFDKDLAPSLKDAGFDGFSQANNHNNDFGKTGIEASRKTLDQNDFFAFGDYFNQNISKEIILGERVLVFVGFNEFSYENFDRVLESIKTLSEKGDIVFVMPHFGVEYKRLPSDFQKEWAHKFVDAGASGVFGAHPHVVQSIEVYKNRPIFYSLGNFVFDQNFSKETTEALALKINLYKKKIEIELLPLDIIASEPSLKPEVTRNEMLNWLSQNSFVSEEDRASILMGYIKL